MINTVPLTADEISTLMMFAEQFRAAQIQAEMAQQMNASYQEILRKKYNLGPEWVCLDALEGFVREEDEGMQP